MSKENNDLKPEFGWSDLISNVAIMAMIFYIVFWVGYALTWALALGALYYGCDYLISSL